MSDKSLLTKLASALVRIANLSPEVATLGTAQLIALDTLRQNRVTATDLTTHEWTAWEKKKPVKRAMQNSS